jgi:four helix bundle protein
VLVLVLVLVELAILRNHRRCRADKRVEVSMSNSPSFDHEKLDVYVRAIELVAWTAQVIDGPLAKCSRSAVKHLDRASTSIALNIAEGNGKRSLADRCRYLDIARGSALESAACLDVLVACRAVSHAEIAAGKAILVRIVAMLSKMVAKLLGAASGMASSSEHEHEHEHEHEQRNRARTMKGSAAVSLVNAHAPRTLGGTSSGKGGPSGR